jgi:hypothetical protein
MSDEWEELEEDLVNSCAGGDVEERAVRRRKRIIRIVQRIKVVTEACIVRMSLD